MQNKSTDRATKLADQIINERFGLTHGTRSLSSYLDHLDSISTAHLSQAQAGRVKASAGRQRRSARISIEDSASVIIRIPMSDPRRKGADHWAVLDFGIWLDLMELGATGAWFFDYKRPDSATGQVRMNLPLRGDASVTNVTIARVIANAKAGQQARIRDHNPLNLRRANIFIIGRSAHGEGPVGRAKTDTRGQLLERKALAASLAGRGYGMPMQGEAA